VSEEVVLYLSMSISMRMRMRMRMRARIVKTSGRISFQGLVVQG
jgi:hypothetical protein